MSLVSSNSRYASLVPIVLKLEDGDEIQYLPRRFVPSADRFSDIARHEVTEGERLDHISAKYMGDPEQFWKICDANEAMKPADLTATPGVAIRITLPEGIPSTPDE